MAFILAAIPVRSRATPLYSVSASHGAYTVTGGFDAIRSSMTFMNSRALTDQFRLNDPSFTWESSQLAVTIHARGLDVTIDADAGSPGLRMKIPSLGNREIVFQGATRSASLRQLMDWFKKSTLLGELARSYAEQSPVDPLAGNPNSAQARTVSTSFDRGFGRLASLVDSSVASGQGTARNGEGARSSNVISVGVNHRVGFGPYHDGSYTVPFGYAWRFDDDVRHQLSLDVPITYQSVEHGSVFSAGVGLGYSHPINDLWVLTGGLDYGMTGSVDLASGGHVLTGTLTSLLTVPLTDWLLVHVGNLVGQSMSLPVPATDYASDPRIRNTVIKNGLMFYFSTAHLLRSSGIELFATDTRYFGSRLYDSGYTEAGASFGFSRVTLEGGNRYDSVLRVGASGLFARGNNGVTLNLGYSF